MRRLLDRRAAAASRPSRRRRPRRCVTDVLVHADTGVGRAAGRGRPPPPRRRDRRREQHRVCRSATTQGRTWTLVDLPNQGDNTTTVDAAGTYAYTSLDGEVRGVEGPGPHLDVGGQLGRVAGGDRGPAPGSTVVPFRFLGCNAPLPLGPVDPISTDRAST